MFVYNDIQINVCFVIEKGEVSMQENTKRAAHKTRIDRQVEKRTYTDDINT